MYTADSTPSLRGQHKNVFGLVVVHDVLAKITARSSMVKNLA